MRIPLPILALLLVALVPARGTVAAPQEEPQELPGDADGDLEESLASALRQRDEIDPSWVSEAQASEWTARIKALLRGQVSIDPAEGGDIDRTESTASEMVFRDLRSAEWRTAYEQGPIRVERRDQGPLDSTSDTLRDAGDLVGELAAYRLAGPARVAVKIVSAEGTSGPAGEGPEAWTEVHASAVEERPEERVETSAIWRVGWTRNADGTPLLVEFQWLEEERTRLISAAPGFIDSTAAAFEWPLAEACVLGLDYWRQRLDSQLGTGLLGHQGFAFGDVNGDGWEDLYWCQPGGLPNRLFLSKPGGVLSDVSEASGADFLDRSASALLLHMDDDAHTDLVVATDQEVLLLAGDGTGRFDLRRRLPASTTTSMAASDYDLDGDLDVYVCGYVSPYDGSATPLPYHDANNGQRNQLLRNDGAFAFTEVTQEVGLDQNNRRFSFAAAWQDYDLDGDPDLYVANDFGRNNLYRNDEGAFVDVASLMGVEDLAAGMGVAWGDVDNDGWEDLYVSNMFSSAGGRIARENAFLPDAAPGTRAAFQRHARGNSLFHNIEGTSFQDVTRTSGGGASMGRWAWGSILFDANDDGRLDVFVPNGMITGHRDDDL